MLIFAFRHSKVSVNLLFMMKLSVYDVLRAILRLNGCHPKS